MKHLLSSSSYLIVNKFLAKKIGLKEAVLLADLISKEQYFIDNKMIKDGWFFNTSKNIESDTTLSRHKQSLAIKRLIKEGFINAKLMGVPATLHFKIIDNKILNFLKTSIKEIDKLDVKEFKTNKNKGIKINNNKSLSIRAQEFQEEVFMSNLSTDICQEFVDYWTETNKSHSKMKFELEKTFDIKRRLSRWQKNDKKWNKKESKIDKQMDSYKGALDLLDKQYEGTN